MALKDVLSRYNFDFNDDGEIEVVPAVEEDTTEVEEDSSEELEVEDETTSESDEDVEVDEEDTEPEPAPEPQVNPEVEALKAQVQQLTELFKAQLAASQAAQKPEEAEEEIDFEDIMSDPEKLRAYIDEKRRDPDIEKLKQSEALKNELVMTIQEVGQENFVKRASKIERLVGKYPDLTFRQAYDLVIEAEEAVKEGSTESSQEEAADKKAKAAERARKLKTEKGVQGREMRKGTPKTIDAALEDALSEMNFG